jgi:O-antigen ligase
VAGAAAAAVVVVVAVAGGWAGRALDDFTNPASIEGQNPGRVASFSSSRRWDWWTESWKLFRRDPLEGAGAGSFYVARRPFKTDLIVVVEPHSLPIQLLGETGIVGFLLLLGVLGAGTAAVIEALRRLDGEERVAATVVALAVLAYLLHTLVDYDWDFVALTGPVLLLVGLLLAAGVPLWEARRRPILASSAALFAVVGVLSLVAPWQSDRKVTQAYDALDRRDAEAALKDADSARSWNPVAIEPVHAAAAAEEARGNRQKALQLYAEAVELQPENPVAWYELAKYEDSVGLRNAAIRHVGRAQQLDPKDEATVRLIQKLFAPPA